MRFDPDEPSPVEDDFDPFGWEKREKSRREAWVEAFLEEFPAATPEQVDDAWRRYQAEVIEAMKRNVGKPQRPAGWKPPPEEPFTDFDDPEPLAAPEKRPESRKDWNVQLRRDRLGADDAYPDSPPTDEEMNRRLTLRPERQAAEADWLHDNITARATEEDNDFGHGITFLRAPKRGGTGRKRSTDRATRVTAADGSVSFARIGNDREAIAEWLTKDGRSVEEYAPAVARGRRSSAANELRLELADRVIELMDMGATQVAVAEVLGCSDKAVRALAK
jgi:hypothetical protein